MTDVIVLGAETQAAISLACAYPDHSITFVSDQDIVDGWDLPNVRIVRVAATEAVSWSQSQPGAQVVPLSPRWLAPDQSAPLSRLFERIEHYFPGRMLCVSPGAGAHGRWAVKGDRWHRPDAPLLGTAQQLQDIEDVHGCGLVYQTFCAASATIMAIGHRGSATQIGCVQVFEERFFWDNILQAGETIEAPDIVTDSLGILDALDHQGFFTLNWLRTEAGLRLTSLRVVPRAIFQMFRKGGVDLLTEPPGTRIVPPGLRMIAAPTYVSYQRLSA